MFWPDPTHQPNHPPTHQTIHPPMGGEFFKNFKSLNGIEISWLVQVLSNFYWFRGSTPWQLADGWMGVEVGRSMDVWGLYHAHTHAHTCTCMYAPTHMHVEHDKHGKHGYLHVGGHLQFLYMYTCVCMHVHVCTCVCMHMGTPIHASEPLDTPHPPGPSPELQGAQNTKIQ